MTKESNDRSSPVVHLLFEDKLGKRGRCAGKYKFETWKRSRQNRPFDQVVKVNTAAYSDAEQIDT